jgi:mRNA-degrading endonuclease RelE of RelBE toxin-antitoxin system
MHLEATRTFVRLHKKLPPDMQQQVKKTLTLFQANPAHPSLRHRKMAGQEDIYELSVSMQYRITYQQVGEIAYLRKVGTHDILRHP